jgi:N-acyl-D-amino-acid deacylase
MSQPLQFTPGAKFAYSNLGFCILGRVVAEVSGQPYESYLRDNVFAPVDVNAASIGLPHLAQRGSSEAAYYTYDGAPLVASVFQGEGMIAPPYSGDPLTLEGAGGWIGSAIDLTRVVTAVDGSRITGFISPDSMAQMLANPNLPNFGDASFTTATWYGLGVFVGPTNETYGHGGLMSGSQTLLWRAAGGYTFAILTNSQASNSTALAQGMYTTMIQALGAGLIGSATDLCTHYPSPRLPPRGP